MNEDIRRILIVDDEANNLQLMQKTLQEHYQLAFAKTVMDVSLNP